MNSTEKKATSNEGVVKASIIVLVGGWCRRRRGISFFLVRGTVLRIKDRRERINFGLRRSSPNEIQ